MLKSDSLFRFIEWLGEHVLLRQILEDVKWTSRTSSQGDRRYSLTAIFWCEAEYLPIVIQRNEKEKIIFVLNMASFVRSVSYRVS